MAQITNCTYENRKYIMVTNPEMINNTFGEYLQIYRMKKDGSRGAQIQTGHIVCSKVFFANRHLIGGEA